MLRLLARELHTWRVMHFSSNKLVRPADRAETVALLILTAIAILSLPLSLLAGSETYANAKLIAMHEQQTRHQVIATVLESPVSSRAQVKATWSLPDGRRIVADIRSLKKDNPGTQRAVWVDQHGAVTAEPRSTESAMSQAVLAGLATAGATFMIWRMLVVTLNKVTDRHRSKAWEAEWATLPHKNTR